MKNYLPLFSFLLIAFACSKSDESKSNHEPGSATLNVSTESLKFEEKIDELNFKVTSDYDWTISTAPENPNWITVTPASGVKGVTTVTVTLTLNPKPTERTARLTVNATNNSFREITVSQAGSTDPEVLDYAGLKAVYDALRGDNWIDNTNWLSDKPFNEWHGVRTYAEDGRVAIVDLRQNGATGSLPADIKYLTRLKHLYLSDNNISGKIPETIGELEEMEVLYLFSNNMEGPLPESLGKLSKMIRLYLYRNGFSGPIPETFGGMTQLETLFMHNTKISGRIPDSFGRLSNLKTAFLDCNELTGEITENVSNLDSLRVLRLYENHFSGNLPQGFGELKYLNSLDLSYNELTGIIPESYGNMDSLVYLDLSHNLLSGEIPLSFLNLEGFYGLRISYNNFSGPVDQRLKDHPHWWSWGLNPQNEGYGFENLYSSGFSTPLIPPVGILFNKTDSLPGH